MLQPRFLILKVLPQRRLPITSFLKVSALALQIVSSLRTSTTIPFPGTATYTLEPPSNSLSSYFFEPSDFSSASAVFNAGLFATRPLQDLPTDAFPSHDQVQLYCANDTDATCNSLSQGDDKSSETTTWGYIGANPVAAQIYACPALLNSTLPRDAPSCTGTPGQATLGSKIIADQAPGVTQSHELVENGSGQEALNAENFAELALWALYLGASDFHPLGDHDLYKTGCICESMEPWSGSPSATTIVVYVAFFCVGLATALV
ncbi:hypothetical protein HO173_009542 [Letharia columbiana]|uniref:Uncharacterized protein n=1 Tax=Letharia columbiana TaxID=112416 RepID=A0A8H6L1L8_9LECA|nr:uncharacterized protein HO173_009542 [Letharia columbiana]KAF6232159.1 hypothetical protein HO173_009542 [Letharia columbiana]